MKINENQLKSIIRESIKKIVKESSESAWENLRIAKETGDPRQILDALHALEAQLSTEGKLQSGGYDKFHTQHSTNHGEPMFGQDHTDDNEF